MTAILKISVLIILVLLILNQCDAKKAKQRGLRKKPMRRSQIVRCCGKKSCQIPGPKRQRSNGAKGNNTATNIQQANVGSKRNTILGKTTAETSSEKEKSDDQNTQKSEQSKGTGSEKDGTGSEKNGTGSETEGTGSEKAGTNSEKEGAVSEKEGTGSETEGTGSEENGTGSDKEGTSSEKEGTGSVNNNEPQDTSLNSGVNGSSSTLESNKESDIQSSSTSNSLGYSGRSFTSENVVPSASTIASKSLDPQQNSSSKTEDPANNGFTATTSKSSVSSFTASTGNSPISETSASGAISSLSTMSQSSSSNSLTTSITMTNNSNSNLASTTTTPTTTTSAPKPTPNIFPECSTANQRNESLFDGNGQLKDSQKYGAWKNFDIGTILLGKKLGTWDDNQRWCEQLGMTAMNILDTKALNRFKSWSNDWEHSARYWFSARISNGTFRLCPSKSSQILGWGQNEPNSTANSTCVAINFINLKVGKGDIALSTVNCSKKLFMACEKIATPVTGFDSLKCAKNPENFDTLDDLKTGSLLTPEKYGTWLSIKKRTFLFSTDTDKQTFPNAVSTCCSIGMSLLDLHQDYIYDNLVSLLKDNPQSVSSGLFWTSANDEKVEGTFQFLRGSRLPSKAKWAPGQPDNAGGKENCLAVDLSGVSYSFKDENCLNTYRYICVAMDTSGSTTGGKQSQSECAAINGLDEDELGNLTSAFNTNGDASAKLKCFMKCMGENTGLVMNNMLTDGKFLRMIEAMHGDDDDKFATKLDDYDECSSKSGEDECDQIARVQKCGVEKDPELVDNMMQAVDVSTPVEKKMLDFKRNNLPNITTSCNKKYLALDYGSYVHWTVGAAACCSYGLKLVSLTSQKDITCMLATKLGAWTPFMTGVSRLNNQDNPRNCFSKKPFNSSLFTWFNMPPGYFVSFMFVSANTIKLSFKSTLPTFLCEE